MPSAISERGQITIDRSAQRSLGVQPGMIPVQVVVGRHEVYFVPPKHNRSACGMLRVREGTEAPPLEELEERASRTIAEDAR